MSSELLKKYFNFDSSYETWSGFECVWDSPPSSMNITCNEVHIWCIQIDMPFHITTSFNKILSNGEKYTAKRFRSEGDRRRYIVSHGALRKILGKYLQTDPQIIQYIYSPFGKPLLPSDINGKQLYFNLSHSDEYALCAVTLNQPIGIDLENIHPAPDIEAMARHFFSFKENEMIFTHPPDQRLQFFYNLWTLKEAYLKATGKGIRNLNNIEISLSQNGLPSVIDKENKSASDDWTILQLKPAAGYAAGLVVEGKDKYTYKFYDFLNE